MNCSPQVPSLRKGLDCREMISLSTPLTATATSTPTTPASAAAASRFVVASGPLVALFTGLAAAFELLGLLLSGFLLLGLSRFGFLLLSLGRPALLGFPAIFGPFLPTLIGLAVNIAFAIRIDVVGPFTRRPGHGMLACSGRHRLRACLVALVAIQVLLGGVAASRTIAGMVAGIASAPVPMTIPASIAPVAPRTPPTTAIPSAPTDVESERAVAVAEAEAPAGPGIVAYVKAPG